MMFTDQHFQALSSFSSTETPCISIYVPTHRANHVEEDRIRFKNALSDVKRNLQNGPLFPSGGMNERETEGFLGEALDLLDDNEFWQNQSDGLAVFIGKDHFHVFTVPVNFNPMTYVKTHFYLRPMMPLLNGEDRFFLLALSQGDVRFFEGHAHHITPVKISDLVPDNLQAAMALDAPEKSLQHHSGGGQTGIHHGHGLHKNQKEWQISTYCRMVDKGLMEMLHDENAPLIIAAVDDLVPLYREVSDYSNIVDFHISGNPENDSPGLLHEKAWSKMKGYFRQEIEIEKDRFSEALAQGKASFALTDILPKAINGRVQTLFLAKDAPVLWGSYDETKNEAVIHEEQRPSSVCLYDLAARKTYDQGGTVWHIDRAEFPNVTAEMNAIYRY